MSESGLDLLERRLEEADAEAPEPQRTASMLGLVGVSAGFAALLALCAVTAITLWVALFGKSLLVPFWIIAAWFPHVGGSSIGS